MQRVYVSNLAFAPDTPAAMLTCLVGGRLQAIRVKLCGPPDLISRLAPNGRRRLGTGTKHYRIAELAAAALAHASEPLRPTEVLDRIEERHDPFDRERCPRTLRLRKLSIVLWNEARAPGRKVESDGQGLYRAAGHELE